MSVLAPAGLIGVDHWAASDAFQYARQFSLGFASHFSGGSHDGPQAEVQPVHGVQIPLDAAPGQPSLFPQGGNQADDVDAEPLPTQRHAVQLRWGQTAPSAFGTGAGQVDVLGYLRRNLGQVNDLPSALGPTPRQLGSTVGTLLYHMLHLLSGRHAGPGKAVATRLAWTFGPGWLPVDFGLQTRHPPGTAGFGLPCQLGNPLLQPVDADLLPDDDANEDISMGSPEIDFGNHASYMT